MAPTSVRKASDSPHVGGVQFVLCDGSVKFISENIDYNLHINATDRVRDGNGPNRTGWGANVTSQQMGTYQTVGYPKMMVKSWVSSKIA